MARRGRTLSRSNVRNFTDMKPLPPLVGRDKYARQKAWRLRHPERAKYVCQKQNARRRGISFRLTFEEWMQIWSDSGKLSERGCRRTCYVMSRYNDDGAYEVGNVFIQRMDINSSYPKQTKLPMGLHLLSNGHIQAYATSGSVKRHLGTFSTLEQAQRAREVALR